MLKKVIPEVEFITDKPPTEWPAEAFLSTILFCCRATIENKNSSLNVYDWYFSRICWLMNTYGNVFDLPFSDKCRANVGGRSISRNMDAFINNLRLTLPDAINQLFQMCNELLNINPRKDERGINDILVKELAG